MPTPKKETEKERKPAIEPVEEKFIPPLIQPEKKEEKSIIEPIKKIIISFKKEKETKLPIADCQLPHYLFTSICCSRPDN